MVKIRKRAERSEKIQTRNITSHTWSITCIRFSETQLYRCYCHCCCHDIFIIHSMWRRLSRHWSLIGNCSLTKNNWNICNIGCYRMAMAGRRHRDMVSSSVPYVEPLMMSADFSPFTTDTEMTPSDSMATPAMPLLPDMPSRSRGLLENLGSVPLSSQHQMRSCT